MKSAETGSAGQGTAGAAAEGVGSAHGSERCESKLMRCVRLMRAVADDIDGEHFPALARDIRETLDSLRLAESLSAAAAVEEALRIATRIARNHAQSVRDLHPYDDCGMCKLVSALRFLGRLP